MKLHLGRTAWRLAKRAAHSSHCSACGYSWQTRDAFAVKACPRCGNGRGFNVQGAVAVNPANRAPVPTWAKVLIAAFILGAFVVSAMVVNTCAAAFTPSPAPSTVAPATPPAPPPPPAKPPARKH